MKTLKFLTLLLIAGTISFTSCKKDDDEPVVETPDSTIKTGDISLSSTQMYKDHWVYFSFTTLAEVAGIDSTNYTTKTNWDIAFHSRLGRTNSGASTSVDAKGGLAKAGTTNFDIVDKALGGYTLADDSVSIVTGIGNYGPTYKKVSGNTYFNDAFDVDHSQQPPVYTPTKEVYIVKTADGKYAKIQITSYFNDEGESGHITFKYAYQSDGSENLK